MQGTKEQSGEIGGGRGGGLRFVSQFGKMRRNTTICRSRGVSYLSQGEGGAPSRDTYGNKEFKEEGKQSVWITLWGARGKGGLDSVGKSHTIKTLKEGKSMDERTPREKKKKRISVGAPSTMLSKSGDVRAYIG